MARDFDPLELTAAQLRAARGLLNWSAQDLADAADVSPVTVRRAELCEGRTNMKSESAEKVVKALRKAGIVLLGADPGGGMGLGVRLRR